MVDGWGLGFMLQSLGFKVLQRFRGGLVFKAHRLCVKLNSRLESNQEEERRVVDHSNIVTSPNDTCAWGSGLRFTGVPEEEDEEEECIVFQ